MSRPDSDGIEGPDGVVVHTKTPDKYLRKAGTTVIPRAEKDGRSTGFKIRPTTVNVIDMSEAADHTMGLASPVVQVDIGAMDKKALKVAAQSLGDMDPMEVYKQLSETQKPKPVKSEAVPVKSETRPSGHSIKAPRSPGQQEDYKAMQTVAVDREPADYGMIREQISLLTNVVQQLANQSMAKAEEPEAEQIEEEVVPVEVDKSKIVNEFNAEIGLGYLTYEPSKPKVKVYFELGGAYGQLAVCYHDVQIYGNTMVFTYDTRYDSGTQYIPPRTQEDNYLSVTLPATGKKYLASSFDLKFTDGPLDRFLLITQPAADERTDNG